MIVTWFMVYIEFSFFCCPFVPGATGKQAAPLPIEDEVLCWRDGRSGFSDVEKPAGGTDKAESRREPGAWGQAQQVPWTTGLEIAEN